MVATVVDPAEAVQLGVWTLLRNDHALMALGITDVYDHDPEPRPYPYVSVPDASSVPDSTHDRHGRAVTVQVHTWARGWLRGRNERPENAVGARVVALLDHQHEALDAVVSGHEVWMIRHERTQHVQDPDREIRHRIDQLTVFTSQDAM